MLASFNSIATVGQGLSESNRHPGSVVQGNTFTFYIVAVLLTGVQLTTALAAGDDVVQTVQFNSANSDKSVVEYSSTFFSRHKLATALDIVEQVPGFLLDDGSDARGFGTAAGNVLINSRRPSIKEDSLSNVLGRIPADQVERIELVRGQVRGVDLRGHSEVVNVVLLQNAPASVRWETRVRKNLSIDRLQFRGNASVSDQWQSIDYNVGISAQRNSTGERASEEIFDISGDLIERRSESSMERGYRLG